MGEKLRNVTLAQGEECDLQTPRTTDIINYLSALQASVRAQEAFWVWMFTLLSHLVE